MTVLPDVICFATADWDAPLWTNKQHLMKRLAGAGVRVLYVDSLGLRAPGLGAADRRRILHRLRLWRPIARQVEPNLWRDSPFVVPAHSVAAIRWVNDRLLRFRLARNRLSLSFQAPVVVWTYNPLVESLLPRSWPIVYHCVDDVAAFPGVHATTFGNAERRLLRRTAACVASSRPLVDHLRRQGARDVTYWPNPADVKAYAAVAERSSSSVRPVIGFVGAVQAHKLDIDLLRACALLRPGWDFELVGPIGEGLRNSVSAAAWNLPANVKLLPTQPRGKLPDTLARFSVGIIPYRVNEYTAGVFPMKLFEYLSSGMPVVSTPLPSLVGEVDHVQFASTPEQFVAALDAALTAGRDPASPQTIARQRYSMSHSWEARVDEALALLRDLAAPSVAVPVCAPPPHLEG